MAVVDVLLDWLEKWLGWVEPIAVWVESHQRWLRIGLTYLFHAMVLMTGFVLGIKYALTYMM